MLCRVCALHTFYTHACLCMMMCVYAHTSMLDTRVCACAALACVRACRDPAPKLRCWSNKINKCNHTQAVGCWFNKINKCNHTQAVGCWSNKINKCNHTQAVGSWSLICNHTIAQVHQLQANPISPNLRCWPIWCLFLVPLPVELSAVMNMMP